MSRELLHLVDQHLQALSESQRKGALKRTPILGQGLTVAEAEERLLSELAAQTRGIEWRNRTAAKRREASARAGEKAKAAGRAPIAKKISLKR